MVPFHVDGHIIGHVRERDITARVKYYIYAGSEHLLRFLKCNKNYIVVRTEQTLRAF